MNTRLKINIFGVYFLGGSLTFLTQWLSRVLESEDTVMMLEDLVFLLEESNSVFALDLDAILVVQKMDRCLGSDYLYSLVSLVYWEVIQIVHSSNYGVTPDSAKFPIRI